MTAILAINRIFFKFITVLLVVSGVGFSLGCQKQSPAPRSAQEVNIAPRQTYLEHTVKYSGETLGIIAKWYTGNANNWRTIAAANPGLKPDRMRLGQLILIPQDLVTQSTPLPARNVRGLAAETKAVTKQIGDSVQKEAEQTTTGETAPAARTIDEDLKELEALDESVKTNADAVVAPEAPKAEVPAPTAAEVNPADANPPVPAVPETAPTVPTSTVPTPTEPSVDEKSDAKSTAGSGAQADDVERERLLDELLQQQ